MKTLQAILLLLLISAASAETIQLFSASTFLNTASGSLSGSLRGGRTIYIDGTGFPTNPTLLEVWIDIYPCKIPADGVTPTTISCETADTFSTTDIKSLDIKVISQGQLYQVPSTSFNYLTADTPSLVDVFPSAATAGTRLNYFGRHRVINNGDGLRDMGDFIGLYVGGTTCSMFDIAQDTISYSSINRAQCDQSPLQEAGRYNITEHVVAGWAQKQYTMRKPSLTNLYFEHTVVPSIGQIYPSSGYDTGQNLQITGTGFSNNPAKIEVNVDNVPCDVTSSTLNLINCRLRPKSNTNSSIIATNSTNQTNGYINGAGFDYYRYDISGLFTKSLSSFRSSLANSTNITLIESKKVMQLESPDIYGENYGQVFKGYFYAPVSGNYTFRGACDDQFVLLMNPLFGTTAGSLVTIISSSSYGASADNYYISNFTSSFGVPRYLEGGRYYYMEAYHINGASSGWLKISVQVPNADTTLAKRTFEVNHIETGFTNDPEVLQFTLDGANGGTFNLSFTRTNSALQVTFSKEVTVAHNANEGDFQYALNQFDSYWSAGITCVNATGYDASGNQVSLSSASKTKTVWIVQVAKLRTTTQLAQRFRFKANNLINVTTPTFTQTTLHDHSPLISGTFTMDIGGQSIKIYDTTNKGYLIYNIPYNVAEGTLQNAIRQIVGFENVEVNRKGDPLYGAKWVISFNQYFSDVPDIVVSGSMLAGGLAGTTPQIAFYETRKYSSDILFNPVSEQFLFSPAPTPNLNIKVNGIQGVCSFDCTYNFISSTPSITSQIKDSTGVIISVAISDPLNSTYPTSYLTVKVDGRICQIVNGTYTSFNCTLPTNPGGSPMVRAGLYDVEVYIIDRGYVGYANTTTKLNYDLVLSSLSPSSGGTNGGYPIIINGKGFPYDATLTNITLCGYNLPPTTITNIATTIMAPACSTGNQTLSYTYNNITKTILFTYNVPNITSYFNLITPTSFSPVKKGVMEINGSGFGTVLADVKVYISNATGKVYPMRVISVNDTRIRCGIPGGLAGNYFIEIAINGIGIVPPAPNTTNTFKYELAITSISPTSGTYYGGTLVTIRGINFSPDILQTLVSIGNELNTLCVVESLNETQIVCRMPPTHPDWTSSTQGVIVTNKIIADSSCPNNNCRYTYSTRDLSPNLTSISFNDTDSGRGSLILTGNFLNVTANQSVFVVLENKLTGVRTVVPSNSANTTTVNFTVPNVPGGFYVVRVRLDPIGQTNSLPLTLRTALTTNAFVGSLKGGSMTITGYGLPAAWPSRLFTLIITTSDSLPISIKVLEATPGRMQVQIPEVSVSTTYTITLKNPTDQSVTATYTQSSTNTPTISITTTSPLSPGSQLIQLTKSTLSNLSPSSIKIYNTINPTQLYPVGSWTQNGTYINFTYTFGSGQYGVKLWFDGYGWSSCSTVINVGAPANYTLGNIQSSYAGRRVRVNGQSIGMDAVLKVAGFVGKAVEATVNYTVFEVPPLLTPEVIQAHPELAKQENVKPAAIISDGGTKPASAFDKLYSTYYRSSAAACYIGLDIGQFKLVNIRRIRYFPYYKWPIAAKMLKQAIIQASDNGINYTQIAQIDQTVHAGWNTIQIDTNETYRFIRFKHNSTSGCKLSEFEVYGVVFNDVPVSDVNAVFTDVTFYDGYNTFSFPGVLNYTNVSTPVVNAITPNNGTIYGGTNVTFSGVNFNVGTPTVVIDGVACTVDATTLTPTFFSCITGSRLSLPQKNTFSVNFGDQHAILKDEFFYVMRWSDIRTWGTDLPPVEGDLVYVPKGMSLYVDQSTPRLDGIIVEDGKLIFADETDMEIHTNLITVNRGEFRAGTEKKPYQRKLTFIMYGSYYGKQQPMFGNKGIGCMECKFSMYGTPRVKTWSVLSSTINVGATTLSVQDTVDWQVGEEIVVASTSFDHNEAERRIITAINSSTITVDQPFTFKHVSVTETYGANRLQMKAQVGLLTRNIKMMGDPSSVEGEYGSHLMMAGRAENGLVSNIAYTEFTHCGQPRIVGRYCIHFHMNGDVPDSYAKGNAVHDSFARVITIHGVHFLTVSENVGYRVKGHNFFIEDGIETMNVIEYNLAIGSLESWNMMQTDISVASFWVTNPTNHLRFNRAAGGDFYGFWYEIKPNPDGPSATEDICPIGNPLGESHDNIAHSYKRFGLRIFKLYSRQIPCQDIRDDTKPDPWASNPSIQSRFYNYILYKNNEAGLLAEETGNVIFENFTIAESKLAGMEFYRTNLTRELVEARNSAIIGLSQNNQDTSNASAIDGARGVIAPRTSGWSISNISFYNFPSTTTAIQTCSKCDNILLYTNTAQEYFVSGITFTNFSGKYLFMNGQKREIIYDTDSSLSVNFNAETRNSSTIVWNFKHLAAEPACARSSTPSKWDNAIVCNSSVTIRKLLFTNLINPTIFQKVPMKVQLLTDETEIVANDSTTFTEFYSLQGNMEPKKDKKESYAIGFVTDRVYNAWWLTGLDFTHLAVDISKNFRDTDKAIVIKFNYTENRELYEIGELINQIKPGTNIKTPTISGPLNRTTCNFGDYTHDNTNRTLTVCLTSRGRTQLYEYLDINGIKCRYLCPSPAGQFVKEPFTRLWTNATQWPNGTMPVAGQNVTIPGEWTIFMNASPEPMNFWLIDGDVVIPDNILQVNITAKAIWVRAGSIKAGTSTTPFPGKITITILGNKQDAGWVLNPDTAGNKLFVVHGTVQFYGVTPSVTWGRAKSIVRRGATSISVTNSLTGWRVGDQVAIGPSFRNYTQHELVTITAVYTANNTISFTPPLNFTHYGASGVTVSNSIGTLDTRAAVGHISRNIKIVSGADQGWGFQMLIQGYNDGVRLRSGSAILQGVEFYNGGQYDTENTVLKLENTVGTDPIKIYQSSFHNCKSYCLDISNINNAQVKSNVFYNARLKHVRALQLNDFTFSNNLMIAATKRPTLNAEELIACYQTHDRIQSGNSITSNLCQGSAYHGFVLPFVPCDQIGTAPYSDNTVGSAVVGFILNVIEGSPCQAASGLKAYACEIGQICSPPGVETIMFEKFMIADSHRAVTLRFGKEGDDRTAFLSNSYISAISRPTCSECYGYSAIDCTDNFGVRMLAVTVNGEHMPSKFGKSFDVICKQEVYDSKAFLENVIFENFRQNYSNLNLTQCSNNVIFKPHDLASDLTGSHHLKNVTCNGCTLTAMAYFSPPAVTQLNWFGGCGRLFCTGKNNYLIHDHTGNMLGSPSILLANNSQIGNNTENCNYIPEINGHHCLRTDLAVLEYESIAPDFNKRIMWPVYLKYEGGTWNSTTNGWREWDWQGNEPLNHRLARFVSVVQLAKSYNMTFESEPPIDMRLQIQRRTTTGDNSDWLIVRLYYPRPNSIRVQNRFGIVKPITLLDNNGENPLNTSQCGSNKYFYQNYTIHFVITGAKDCQVRVSLTNSIQLNARIDMDINLFFAADGQTKFIDRMCAVLGIADTSRVKIVSIFNSSVGIVATIDQSQTTTVDNATSANNTAAADEMRLLQARISAVTSNGALGNAFAAAGLGPLLQLQTQVYYHEDQNQVNPENPADQPEEDKPIKRTATAIGLIVGIVVGSVVLIGVGVVGFIYFMRKRAKVAQLVELQPSQEKVVNPNNVTNLTENESLTTFGIKK